MTAPANPAFTHAHEALLRQGDFQFTFPSYIQPKTPDWLKALVKFLYDHGTVLEWIFWIVFGLVVCFVLYHLVRAYWPVVSQWRPGERKTPGRVTPQTAWRPTQAQARQLLKEADALAAEGLYAEAVHLLLLRSIEDIQERRAGLVRPTLTSREIGMLRALPGPAREAFAGIAHAVERGLFANLPIGAEDFARCRQDYESFALPNWSQAA